jgi:hypothetical protein
MEINKEFLDAFKVVVWDEFGRCDLPERLKYYYGEAADDGEEEDESQREMREHAETLQQAFAVLENWYAKVTTSKTWSEQEAEEYEQLRREREETNDKEVAQ